MLKVAIIGCGKIADEHAAAIQRIGGCEIVGVCDQELLMAEQLAQRFPVKRHFSDVPTLLSEARPDVVHITTPPASHFELAMVCLDAGCHLYVEKPFTLYAAEARALIEYAAEKHLKLTVGHDAQFGHAARRMRALVASGYLGSGPIHIESYYSYEFGQTYARALLGDSNHWVRKLPGQLLHNLISHGIARIAEFLPGDDPRVMVHGFTSPFLSSLGETELIDELRVIISAEDWVTAYFTFSTQIRPAIHQLRLYGSKHGLVLDPEQETLVMLRGTRFTSYADKFIPPLLLAQQYLGNAVSNMRAFAAHDFHMKSGMKHLIESFYRAIVDQGDVPIPYREIIITSSIMESIFSQLHSDAQVWQRRHHLDPVPR
jgi:predicted dehydrogenase